MLDMYDSFAGFDKISTFEAQDGHRYVDVFQDEMGDMAPRFVTGILRHGEIAEWLNAGSKPTFRLLIAKPQGKERPGVRRYPLSLETLHQIVAAFGIPKAFVNLAVAHTTGTFDLGARGEPENRYGILSVLGRHALAVTRNPTNRTTYALIMKLCNHQTENLIETLRSRISELSLPMTVAVAWLNIMGQLRARRVMGRREGVSRSEINIGIHWSRESQAMKTSIQDLDFQEITRHLTVLGSEATFDAHAVEAQLEAANVCAHVQATIDESSPDVSSESNKLAFNCRLRHAQQMLRGLRAWTLDTQQRVQVHVQTVYSLVSQRDNEVNYLTAVASQRIAEAAQRDGALMKRIAEDSREVSLRAWRDGVDMRIMAAVTLLTLPGTFTATLFSTSFFDFRPAEASNVVSGWIWLYCAVTAGMTAAFVMAWYSIHRAMARRVRDAIPSSSSSSSSIKSDSGEDDTILVDGNSLNSWRKVADQSTSLPLRTLPTLRPPRSFRESVEVMPEETAGEPRAAPEDKSEEVHFHVQADAMAPESFGKACAICGEPID